MRAASLALWIAMGFCTFLCARPGHAEVIVGQPAPAFTSPTLDGKVFDLSTLKGKVVVVHFWATWCAPCREEMPSLEAVWRQYHDKGLEVLAVSADRPRAHSEVKQVMQYFTFPASLMHEATKNDLGVPSSIPVTYVIGKTGNIENILTPDISPLTEQSLGDDVKTLLDAKPAEPKVETKAETKSDVKP